MTKTLANGAVLLDGGIVGQGSDFVVLSGRCDGARVVVKAAKQPDEWQIDRLERELAREAEALSRVAGPGVPRVHGLWRLPDGRLGLVRDHVAGTPLGTIIERGLVKYRYQGARRWSPATKALIGAIGAELSRVHRRGVVHNDVKPDNVLVDTVSDAGRARIVATLVDYGVASGKGLGGSHGGTVFYAAPERLEGAPADARSDVFSLGVLVYELLSGTRPYPASTTADALFERQVPVERLTRDNAVRAWVSFPPEVQAALSRALSWDPRRRPRSVAAFLKALGVDGKAPKPVRGEDRRDERGPRRAWGMLLGAVAATALVVWLGWPASLAGAGPRDTTPAAAVDPRCERALEARAERICAHAGGDVDACREALTALLSPGECGKRMRQLSTCPGARIGMTQSGAAP